MIRNIKEKLVGATGSISGVASVLGSWQVCHSACLGLIALLSVIGITIVGMPLVFLTSVAVPFWIAAFILLLITIVVYFKKGCISKNLILINSGLIIAGVPFAIFSSIQIYLWIIGGLFVATGIFFFVKDKFSRKKINRIKMDKSGKNYQNYILYGLLVFLILGFIISFVSFSSVAQKSIEKTTSALPETNLVSDSLKSVSTGSTNSGDALIELTPHKVVNGKLVVDASFSTHSVTLSAFDLKQITTLEYDGKVIQPSSALLLSGHHNNGEIVFDVDKDLTTFTIKIKGIPNIEDRVFEWR